MNAAAVVVALGRFRLSVTTEADLQASIAQALVQCGVAFVREHPLSRGPVDFFLPESRIAIEAKVEGSPASVTKQVVDYLADDQVAGLVLVTAKRNLGRLPAEVLGKPVAVLALWRGML